MYLLIGNMGEKDTMIKFYPSYNMMEEEALSFEYPQWSCVVSFAENVYLVGGELNDSSCSTCRKYSIKTFSWSLISNLIIPRDSASIVSFNDAIYVFGGYSNNISLSSIEKYDSIADSWILLRTKIPIPLAFTGCVNCGTSILIFGGEFNDRNSDKVFRWDGFGRFEECPNLEETFTSGSSDIVLLIGEKIYIVRADQEGYPRIEIVNY